MTPKCNCCHQEIPRPVGRPSVPRELKRVQISYKIPRWLKGWIDKQEDSGGRVIEKALVAFYGLKEAETKIKALVEKKS